MRLFQWFSNIASTKKGEVTFRIFEKGKNSSSQMLKYSRQKGSVELTVEEKELVCIMRLYLNLVSVMIKADPCDNGTGVQESASWVL